jgi:nitrogen fixation protein NifX
VRVAFATGDCEHVDEQFRRSSHLVVYELTSTGFRLDRIYAFGSGSRLSTDDRIRTILGSAIVYVATIGPSVAARLVSHGIQPATAPAGSRIQDLLAELWQLLASRHRASTRRAAETPLDADQS